MNKVKIIISQHILKDKIPIYKSQGWNITEEKIKRTLLNPKWKGTSPFNQPTAMSLIDENYILRVVYNKKDDIMFAVTIIVTKRGRYESTKT